MFLNRLTATLLILSVFIDANFALCEVASSEETATEPSNDFYQRNAALTIFGDDVTLNQDSALQMLRIKKKKEDELKKRRDLVIKDAQAPHVINQEQQLNKKDENLSPQQQILEKFGDPGKDVPILGEDKAPAPFRAMMAAFEAGDQELAFQYARQYVRHVNNVKERTNQALALQALAMKKEGLLAEGNWADDERFDAQRAVLAKQLSEEETKNLVAQVEKPASIDPQIKTFLDQAAKAESLPVDELEMEAFGEESKEAPSRQEKNLRAEARSAFNGKAPIDPNGKVDLFFFLRTSDDKSLSMAVTIESIWRKVQADNKLKDKIRIIGLTLGSEAPSNIEHFRNTSKTHFPITNGAILAKKLNIKSTPTFVAVAHSSGEAILEEGPRTFYYLDELVRYMGGAK